MEGWTGASRTEILGALVAVFASVVLLYYLAEARKRRRLPPGPWPYPVVGNFPALGELPHRSLVKLAKEYGELLYLRLGSQPCIVISSATVAKAFYKSADSSFLNRPKRLSWTVWHNGDDKYRPLAGTSDLPYHKRLRRLYNSELFSSGRHSSQEQLRAEEIRHMTKLLLDDCRSGEPADIKAWLYGVTSNIMTRIIVGKRFYRTTDEDGDQQREDLVKMTSSLVEIFGAVVISDFVPYLSFINHLRGHVNHFAKVRDFSEELTKKFFDLDGHRKQLQERGDDPTYIRDMEDVLLETPLDGGEHLSDKDLFKVLQELLQAGTEPSATLVEWAMAELMLHPTVLKRAQQELADHIPSRLVTEADLPHLPYLSAVIKESFRMHPPAPLLLPHESNVATNFLGYDIPQGTLLFINAFAIQRDPIVYDNPEEFDPEKFVGSKVSQLNGSDDFELLPFGGGRRMCPAYNLGNTMATLMLANLMHCFEWQIPEKVDMSEINGLTVGMKEPLCLVAKPRFEVP